MAKVHDIAVIGAGVAGTSAALAAAGNGARVIVYAHAPGATALFSGAWRGPLPDGLDRALQSVGYTLEPVEHPLPHPNGFLVTASYATSTQRAAQLSSPATVVGIAGLPAFNPEGLAAQWSAASGIPLEAMTITLPDTPAAGWSVAALSSWIGNHPDALAGLPPRSILPAIGSTHAEALAAPPSLPGLRLQQALERVLAAAGIEIVRTRLTGIDRDSARAFVLASGKFIAGGIEANEKFVEPVFDCPLWLEHLDEVFDTPDPLLLTDPDRRAHQPLLTLGVHADAEHRPVNRMGDVVYENVFVAGAVRAEWTTASHGIGDAALDGWNAGLRATR